MFIFLPTLFRHILLNFYHSVSSPPKMAICFKINWGNFHLLEYFDDIIGRNEAEHIVEMFHHWHSVHIPKLDDLTRNKCYKVLLNILKMIPYFQQSSWIFTKFSDVLRNNRFHENEWYFNLINAFDFFLNVKVYRISYKVKSVN